MKSEALAAAYQATTYRVFLPAGVIDLRLGESNAALARWLKEEGCDAWAIITAHNPSAGRLTADENAERQAQLECLLLERGYEPYAGESVADADGEWPDEETCLIAGISVKDCTALAQQFGQNAIVCGGNDGLPNLHWVSE